MENQGQMGLAEPVVERSLKTETKRKRQPKYKVMLWDDDDHSYGYVITMMRELFGHSLERGFEIATEVDSRGFAICLTTTMEHAELKRDQIRAYGRDELIASSQRGMRSTIEPVE